MSEFDKHMPVHSQYKTSMKIEVRENNVWANKQEGDRTGFIFSVILVHKSQ